MKQASKRILALSVSAAFAGVSGGAAASAFQLMEQNASGLGLAYAGQGAWAQDASTVFFNPAGMTRLSGRQIVGALNAIKPVAEFTNTGSTVAPLQTSLGNNGGDAGGWALVPNAYMSWQINPNFFFGIGMNAPYGLKTEYDPRWVGRFHAIESELKTLNINPSIAFKITNQWSLGMGVNWQRADATLSNSVNYSAAAFGAGGAPLLGAIGGPGVEGIATVKGHDDALGWNVGLMWEPNANTRLGLSYRSDINYTIKGDVAFANRPAALAAGLPDGPVNARVTLPAQASLSVFHAFNPQWEVLADVSWTGWHTIQALNINRASGPLLSTTPLNWDDTWRVGLGVNYNHNAEWSFRAGVAYDKSPVPDVDRTPRIPDQDRTWLAFGVQYRMSKQFTFDVGYAHIFVKDASVNLCNAAQAAANPAACSGKNNLVGNYGNNKVDIISAQVKYQF